MGLFDSPSTKTKTVVYGQQPTDILQPSLFSSYQDWTGGGIPMQYRMPLMQAIQSAYDQARNRLGPNVSPDVLSMLNSSKSANTALPSLAAASEGARGRATSNMASYISNLTSGRPGYSVMPGEPSKWGQVGNLLQNIGQVGMLAGAAMPTPGPTATQAAMGNQIAQQTATQFANPWLPPGYFAPSNAWSQYILGGGGL